MKDDAKNSAACGVIPTWKARAEGSQGFVKCKKLYFKGKLHFF